MEILSRFYERSKKYQRHHVQVRVSYRPPSDTEAPLVTVRGTVVVGQIATVEVHLRRAPGQAEMACSCALPREMGMPCKHVMAVFPAAQRDLEEQAGGDGGAVRLNYLDACWINPVWHTRTWSQQYEEEFTLFAVRCSCEFGWWWRILIPVHSSQKR